MQAADSSLLRQSATPLRAYLLLVFLLGVLLRFWALSTEGRQSPDTFEYARQSAALQQSGLSSLRLEAARFLAEPGMTGIPVVSRSLWLVALAGWSRLTHTAGPSSVASLACVADVLALGVVALLAGATLGTEAAIAATLLYAVSPAALYTARHGLGESLTSLLGLLNLLFACRALARPGRSWPLCALGILAGLTFAVKETAFIQSTLVVAFTATLLHKRGRRRAAYALATAFLLALLATLAWNAYALGGFSTALRLSGAGRDPHGLIPYAVIYQSGTPLQWLQALFLLDPAVFTLGLIGLAIAFALAHRTLAERPVLLLCATICIAFVALPVLLPNLYNARWLSPAYGPACMLSAFALQKLWQNPVVKDHARTRSRRAFAVCVLGLCAVLGVWRYRNLIAAPDLQDLSLKMILTAHN